MFCTGCADGVWVSENEKEMKNMVFGNSRLSDEIGNVNLIIAVGSVDGVLTTAAFLRAFGLGGAEIIFCQAFTVDKVAVDQWQPNRKVLFIDLAVNNRDEQMTVDFVARLTRAGHKIVGVCDEHDAEAWSRVLETNGLRIEDLAIQPVSQKTGDIKSSGALLLSYLGEETNFRTRELCEAADAADRMDFSTHFGGLINMAVKTKIADDSRRVYLAKHFASQRLPDEKIIEWIAEYEAVLKTHGEIISSAEMVYPEIIRVDTVGKVVDMTTLLFELYNIAPIVIVDGESYSPSAKAKVRQISVGLKPEYPMDITVTLQSAGVKASGFAQKANLPPEEEEKAIAAIRAAIEKTE